MKEIKFRAWDKKYNLMIQPDSTMAYDTFIAFDGTVHELGEWSGYSGGGKTDEDVTKNYILMQYTGLKDKNGIEIYVGDILECTSELLTNLGRTRTGTMSTTLYQVIWHKEGWGKKVIKSQQLVLGFESNGLEITLKYSLVIGNIYANPELLEVTP